MNRGSTTVGKYRVVPAVLCRARRACGLTIALGAGFARAQAFSRIDAEGTGFITTEDIDAVLAQHGWSRHSVEAMLASADLNNDGRIDYYEFLTLMRGSNDDDGGKEAKIAGLFLPRF